MAEIKLPELRNNRSGSLEEEVQNLKDAFFMLKKHLTYLMSGNLDETNVIRAKEAIILDPTSYIAWEQVDGAPTIPTTPEDIGAKPYDWMPAYGDITGIKPPVTADNTLSVIGANRLTYIDGNGIYTGTLTAQQINAIQGITLGANATINWAALPSLPTASQIGALPSSTYIPSTSDITQITANYVSTPNLVTNIAQVSNSLSLGSSSTNGSITFKSGASIYSYDTANGPYFNFDAYGLTLAANDVNCGGNWHFSGAYLNFGGASVVNFPLPSHTHDDRYYTETEANARFIRPYYGSSNYCYLDYGGGSTITVRNSSGTNVGMIQLT